MESLHLDGHYLHKNIDLKFLLKNLDVLKKLTSYYYLKNRKESLSKTACFVAGLLEYKLFQTEVKDFFTGEDYIEWTDEECEYIRSVIDD